MPRAALQTPWVRQLGAYTCVDLALPLEVQRFTFLIIQIKHAPPDLITGTRDHRFGQYA